LSIYRKRMAGAIYSEAQNAVAGALTAARLGAGLKQVDLAKAIGKHQSYISDIERGQRRVDILEFYALARAMKLEPSELYAEVTKDLPPLIKV
jgi:transcriptional regulator with XRE-family HTH domain